MATKHSHTSSVRTRSPEVLVVDAGLVSGGRKLDVVEVLLGDQSVDHIPDPCLDMHSMFHDGNLYFLGGRQGATVYTCTCASLMSSCGNNTTTNRPLWRTFKAPDCNTAAVSYSSCLVSINDFCTIGAYSSWVEATSTGGKSVWYSYKPYLYISYVAAVVLPTVGLVYAYQDGGVYKMKLSDERY